MAGVPVAVVIEGAGFFEDAGEFHAAGAHVVDVGLGAGVAVFKRALFFRLAPKDFIISVAVKRRIDVDQVHAGGRKLFKLLQIVAAINDARIDQRG